MTPYDVSVAGLTSIGKKHFKFQQIQCKTQKGYHLKLNLQRAWQSATTVQYSHVR